MFDDRKATGNPGRITCCGAQGESQQQFPDEAPDTLVFFVVAGVGAGQAAQCHHPRHEAEIGVRFAGRDELVYLVGLGEVVQRLGRGLEGFLRPV